MMQVWAVNANVDLYVDMAEICGGVGGTSKMYVRRYHRRGARAGLNLDLVCGCNLLDPRELEWVWCYIRVAVPIVLVISTPCRGMAGWSSLNRVINHGAWVASQNVSDRLCEIGSDFALHQLVAKRRFW